MNSRRKLRVGMVGGGGPASFFGGPHRRAILMDNSAELTAGACGASPTSRSHRPASCSSRAAIPTGRRLVKAEAALPESERIDYLTIVTPNDAHFGPADAAAAAGIGVLCEKPLTTTLDEARRLHATVRPQDIPFVVAYTYTGFPMVMLARELVRDGAIGEVRKVEAWYPQGWLATKLEAEGQKQASWRVDPTRRAPRAAAATSARTPTSSSGSSPAARHPAPGPAQDVRPRPGLDDDFTVLAELDNGGIATIAASQITIGPRTTTASASSARPARSNGRSPTTPS